MKNSMTVKIPLWFKGELFEPSLQFNLDDWALRDEGELPNFTTSVAKANGIGNYSYELEVMESAEVVFENPTGLAIEFLNTKTQQFDFIGFKHRLLIERYREQLNNITLKHLNQPLEVDSPLHNALMDAFILGKNSA